MVIRRLPSNKISADLLTNAFLLASASLLFFSRMPPSGGWDSEGSTVAVSQYCLQLQILITSQAQWEQDRPYSEVVHSPLRHAEFKQCSFCLGFFFPDSPVLIENAKETARLNILEIIFEQRS